MNRDIAEQWIAALESGDYRQAQQVLVIDAAEGKSYCCLGVLCDLAHKAGVLAPEEDDWWVATDGGSLPDSVMNWSGVKTAEGEFKDRAPGSEWLLTGLNDNGANFTEIAQVIRDNMDIL